MNNWIPIRDHDINNIWERFFKEFRFKPSTSIFPSFQVPHPFITYDLSIYGEPADKVDFDDLDEKAWNSFKEISLKDEYILALDWQHECYFVNPHLRFERNKFNECDIPIFPDGDYYFFIQKDFKWGCLGHPWERSLTIFGDEFIHAFNKHKPKMLRKVIRQSEL